ncbi:nucleotidyltransferase domain-containing protein [Nanoarchaeota archaeon]
MYDNTCLEIIKQIYLTPGIHKRGLSKKLKVGMPSIDYALKKIEKLLTKKKSGNQITYFLDYSKEDLVPMLHVIEHQRLEKLPSKVRIAITSFLSELKEKPIIAIIFGSYAVGDYTKKSDIDILLIFQKLENSKLIESVARRVSMKTNTKINPVYLDYDSFITSFHDSTKEFFKKLKENKIIILGFNYWRQIVNEEA